MADSNYNEKLKLYDRLIDSFSQIKRKGKKIPYTSVNGHMFSFLDQEGIMGLRLSREDQEEFNKKYNTGPMIQYEREMKEYVVVPSELLKKTKNLADYLQKSYDYVSSLKPKSTKRKQK